MSTNTLAQFRTTYLRAIAWAWANETFRRHLTTDAEKALSDLFEYKLPWDGVTLSINAHGATWDPSVSGGWHSGQLDYITLNLPLDPGQIEVQERDSTFKGFLSEKKDEYSRALSAYYEQRPTLLGQLKDKESQLDRVSSGNPGNPGVVDFGEFLTFGAVTLRAMAIAWNNEPFRTALTSDAATALQGWTDYNSPWNFQIKIVDCSKYVKLIVPTDSGKLIPADQRYWNLDSASAKNEIGMFLPRKPEIDAQPLALIAYNNTGGAYPFTCCA